MTDLQVFVMGEESPTCPWCGRRTQWDSLPGGRQHHKCACGKEFLLAPAEEDEPDTVTITVKYYGMLANVDYMVEVLNELEGVEEVTTDE